MGVARPPTVSSSPEDATATAAGAATAELPEFTASSSEQLEYVCEQLAPPGKKYTSDTSEHSYGSVYIGREHMASGLD